MTTTGKSATRSSPSGRWPDPCRAVGCDLQHRGRIVGNLHRASADLGAAEGVDMLAALTDMVAFNGGQPLSCYA